MPFSSAARAAARQPIASVKSPTTVARHLKGVSWGSSLRLVRGSRSVVAKGPKDRNFQLKTHTGSTLPSVPEVAAAPAVQHHLFPNKGKPNVKGLNLSIKSVAVIAMHNAGFSPSEIAAATAHGSLASVVRRVDALKRKGYIKA